MSREDITSVLLPASSVDFFLIDQGTRALVDKLKIDWRFARVSIDVDASGMEAAISRYTETASPELIIIETNDISEAFIAQLEELAGHCSENTDAIIVGPENDVHLYRSLVEMGVKDYLVRPVSEDDMLKVVARTLVEKRGFSGSRLVTVIGSKGGAGSTSVAQALSWNITNNLKQKTMLMDVAGGISSIGIAYGAEPSSSLTEAVRMAESGSEDDMNRIYQSINEYLSLLVSGSESVFSAIPDPDHIEILLNRVMQRYPVVVVDLSDTSRAVQKRLIELSSNVVVVTTPTISALRNARTLLNEIKSICSNLDTVDLIVNMKGVSESDEVPTNDISEALGVDPALTIPYLPKLFAESETMGKPIGENKAAEELLNGLMPVAEKAAAVKGVVKEEESVGMLQGLMNKFVGNE